jgi:hypothetical protein
LTCQDPSSVGSRHRLLYTRVALKSIKTIRTGFWRWLDPVAGAMIAIVARGASPRTVRLVENEEGQFAIVVADRGDRADWRFTHNPFGSASALLTGNTISRAAQGLTSD